MQKGKHATKRGSARGQPRPHWSQAVTLPREQPARAGQSHSSGQHALTPTARIAKRNPSACKMVLATIPCQPSSSPSSSSTSGACTGQGLGANSWTKPQQWPARGQPRPQGTQSATPSASKMVHATTPWQPSSPPSSTKAPRGPQGDFHQSPGPKDRKASTRSTSTGPAHKDCCNLAK